MSELTPTQQIVLDALWEVPARGPATADEVRSQAARMGHWRALSTIRRALDQLVELDYADRTMVRGVDRVLRAYYFPTSRAGERLPPAAEGSRFLTWLWKQQRFYWRLWCLQPAERMVWVNGWGMRATPEEWAWLASRPVMLLEGQRTPDQQAWWEDSDHDG